MSFNPQDKPQFELIPEGLQAARVARVIEIGVQKTPYGDKEQVVFEFLLPKHTIEIDGVEKQKMKWIFPVNISHEPKSKLMEMISCINPDATDLGQLLGCACMLQIKHEEKKGIMRDNVTQITMPVDGMDIAMPDIDTYFYEVSNAKDEVFDLLREYRQKQIEGALNFAS